MKHSAWLWNHLPHHDSGLSQIDIFPRRLHMFIIFKIFVSFYCASYVIESRLQDGHKFLSGNLALGL